MTIKITVKDIYSTVRNIEALPAVRQVCRARPDGYQFMSKFKSRRWDGYISLMNGFSMFPTGLLDIVIKALEDKKYNTELIYDTQFISSEMVTEDCLNGVILRDYQVNAANKLLDYGRGIAKMATNSGKTLVFSAIIQAVDKKATVIVSSTELLYQTSDMISERLGCEVGRIGDGIYDPKKITVAMVQTLCTRLNDKDLFKHFSDNVVVIIDECHHTSSNQMMDVLFKLPGCYRYGFSGTPLKYNDLDDLKLIAVTGRVLCDVTNEELIEEGWSAKPQIKLHIIENGITELDYQEAYTTLIVQNELRNGIIVRESEEAGGVVLVLVNRIEHGKLLNEMIDGSIFVNGSNSSDYRLSILQDMQEKPGVYIATPIFDEGVDVPNIDTIILAAGGKSHVKLLQRIGRGLRKKEGENILTVHDFIDDTNKYLFTHSEKRLKVYEQERFDREIVR